MTRDEIYSACEAALCKSNVLLLESATGTGKSLISIKLVNWLSSTTYKDRKPKMLLLVAKRVHKQTWKDEFDKWGGINADVTVECYESLHKHVKESFNLIVVDETHHLASEARQKLFRTLHYGYIIGLSATIPDKLKMWFKYYYHAQIVTCDIVEAIEDEILPEPTILLLPLQIENSRMSETIEINPKSPGPIVYGEYKDYWTLKRKKVHAILRCTQRQKLAEIEKTIEWARNKSMMNPRMKQTYLYFCGKRLEFFADCKIPTVKMILSHLKDARAITFCRSIEQCEKLGKYSIHSQNKDAALIYDKFNRGEINQITSVNILNENANLVNCKYAVFCNIPASDIVMPQRIGRALRHKSPVIIVPYYKGTREEELITEAFKDFRRESVKVIKSISEI